MSVDLSVSPAADRPARIGAYGWYVILMLLVAGVFSFLDRMVLGLLIDPIKAEMSLSDTEVSLLAGFAFASCYIVFAFPFGRWADTRNRRNIIALGIVLWSIATVACGLATSFWTLFLARMFVGVGEASTGPSGASMIPDIVPAERRSLAMAVLACGLTIGGGLAFLLGGYFVQWASEARPVLPFVGQIAPWKIAFIGVGLPGILLGLVIWATVREPVRQRTASALDSHAPPWSEVFGYMRRHAALFVMMFAGYCGFAINGYAYNVWGPAYLARVHHMAASEVGLLLGSAFAVTGTGGIILGGMISDWLVRRGMADAPIRIGVWSVYAQIPLFLAAYTVPETSIAATCLVVGMFVSCLMAGQQIVMVQMLTPGRMRGTMTAVFLVCANVTGIGIAPTVIALISDHVYSGPQAIGYALATVTSLALASAFVLISLALPAARARAEALRRDTP